MAVSIIDVAADELPEYATHGFRVDAGDPDTVLFFHWNEPGWVDVTTVTPDENGEPVEASDRRELTTYADVLAALPVRLRAYGASDATVDDVFGRVIEMYGEAPDDVEARREAMQP